MQKRGLEQTFLEKLSPSDRELYTRSLPVSWIPVQEDPEDMGVAAELLFPDNPLQLQHLGILSAPEQIQGIYQIFFKIPTVAFIMKRVAQVWRFNFDTGQAMVENVQNQSLEIVIKDFPDLPAYLREFLCGYYMGVIEITGAKNLRVTKHEKDPQAWRWMIQWD